MLKSIKDILIKNFKGKITTKHLAFLPSGYYRVGDIIVVNFNDLTRIEKEIGNIIINNLPNVRVVCRKAGGISGELRIPKMKIIAGDRSTETVHKENGCLYKLDVRKVMFAKGNVKERGRIAKLVQSGEVVVDLFAGVGYFCLPIARFNDSIKIYAIDVNPTAIKYLKENIQLNKVEEKIVPLLGDCRKIVKKLGKIADRVIMGYLPKTFKFLPYAFEVLKKEGVIHYHDVFRKEELWDKPIKILEDVAKENGCILSQILHKRIVKSYAPKVYHIVIDAKFCQ